MATQRRCNSSNRQPRGARAAHPRNPHAPVVRLQAEQADVVRAAPHVRRLQPVAQRAEQSQRAGDVTGGHQVRDQGGSLRSAAAEIAEHALHGQGEFGGPSVEHAALDLRTRPEGPQFVPHTHPTDGRGGAAEHPRQVLRRVLGGQLKHGEISVAARRQIARHGRGDVEVYLDPLRVRRRAGRRRHRLVPGRRRRRRQVAGRSSTRRVSPAQVRESGQDEPPPHPAVVMTQQVVSRT